MIPLRPAPVRAVLLGPDSVFTGDFRRRNITDIGIK